MKRFVLTVLNTDSVLSVESFFRQNVDFVSRRSTYC
jgi:hypothetical protein